MPCDWEISDREEHTLADVLVGRKDHVDQLAGRARRALAHLGSRGQPRRRVDGDAPVGRDGSRTECERGNVPFPDRAQAEDEAKPTLRRARLVGVRDDAGVEQRRRLEGVLVEEAGTHELPLDPAEVGVIGEGVLHLVGPGLEGRQQAAVATLEILQDIREEARRGLGIERQDPVDDVVRARSVGRVEVPRLGRRTERSHDHPRRVGAQIQGRPVQERDLRQGVLGSFG